MSRTAGFSLVASFTEQFANEYLESYFASSVAAQPIPLPLSVSVGGTTVNLSGEVGLIAPEVSFSANSGNVVGVSATLIGEVSFSTAGVADQTWIVLLYATVDLPLATGNDGSLLYPGFDLSQINVLSLGVQVVQDESAPESDSVETVYQDALSSGAVLEAVNAGLRHFAPAVLPLGTLSFPTANLYQQARSAPFDTSEFPPFPTWFSISLTPNRIAPIVTDGGLTIGVDLNHYTSGDATQLVDLNTTFAPGSYIQVLEQDGSETWTATESGVRNTGLAVLMSQAALSALLTDQVSNVIGQTLIDNHISPQHLTVTAGYFDAGINGTGYGATIGLDVVYYADTHRLDDGWGYFAADSGSANLTVATVTFHLQSFLSTRDGDTSWTSKGIDAWQMRIVDANIAMPAWLEPLAVFGSIVVPCAVAAPLAIFSWMTGITVASEIQSLLDNADFAAAETVNQGLASGKIAAQKTMALQNTTGPEWLVRQTSMALTEDGLDVGLKFSLSDLPYLEFNGIVAAPVNEISVYDSPITVSLHVTTGYYRADDPSLFADWAVTRTDTEETVLAITQQLSRFGLGASVSIDNASAELTASPGFMVACRLYRLRGYRTEEIYSSQMRVDVEDIFDRHHLYVYWDHTAHFADPASTPSVVLPSWKRDRSSAIHRTAITARCLEMRRRERYPNAQGMGYGYLDELPTGDGARKLCAYCFYGGPTKTVLKP